MIVGRHIQPILTLPTIQANIDVGLEDAPVGNVPIRVLAGHDPGRLADYRQHILCQHNMVGAHHVLRLCQKLLLVHFPQILDGLWEVARGNGVEAVILEGHRNWIKGFPMKSFQVSGQWLNVHI